MNDIMRDITAIATAIIGVAILTVLVKQGNNTTGVINAAASGFSTALSTAMGNPFSGGTGI